MPTLLRSTRRCSVCHNRAHCQLIQLLVPGGTEGAPFFNWFDAWLCSPCQRSVVDMFNNRGLREIQVYA